MADGANTQDMLLALSHMKESNEQEQADKGLDEQLVTPRTLYSNKQFLAEQMGLQLMMHLTAERISSMETEFAKRGGGVQMDDFVRIMIAHLPEYLKGAPRPELQAYRLGWEGDSTTYNEPNPSRLPEKELVANLCELFKEIDINGDGDLLWEELTSFIVEKAVVFKERYRVTEINDYHQTNITVEQQYRFRHNNYLEKLHYLPKLNQVAVIEQHSPVVSLYHATNGRLVANLKGHRGVPMAMQHVEKRNCLITCCADMTMVAWNLYPDTQQYTVRNCWPTPHVQMCMCWVDTHEQLYSGSTAGMLHAWSVDDREEKSCWYAHNDIVMELLSMPSLDNIASASLDTTICIWDTYTAARRQELRGHTKGVFSLAYNQDYRMLISAGFDHDAFIWSPFVPTLLFKLKGHSGSLVGVESVPGTPEVITADSNGYFKLWDLRNFQCVQTWTDEAGLSGMNAFVHSHVSTTHQNVAASIFGAPQKSPPTSRIIAATKKLHFFDQGSSEKEPVTDDLHITCACYNPTSLTIITAAGRSVKIWNAISGNVQRYYRNLAPSEITALCLDDRQRKFIVGDDKGRIGVYNYTNGALMKNFETQEGEVTKLVYCNKEKAVISVSSTGDIMVHDEMDAEMGIVLRKMDAAQKHTGDIIACTFSHASSLVATGATDQTVKVWDFETGKLDGMLQHDAPLTCVAFMGDYPLLITADTTGVIRVWGVRSTPFKYECCFCFLHGKPEDGMALPMLESSSRGPALFLPNVKETIDPVGPHGTKDGDAEVARRASIQLVVESNMEAIEMKKAFEMAARTGKKEDIEKAEELKKALRETTMKRKTVGAKNRRASASAAGTGEGDDADEGKEGESKESKGEAEEEDDLALVMAAALAASQEVAKPKVARIPRGKYSAPRGPSMVLSIAYDERTHMMYTGDDNGCVQGWSIRKAVLDLGIKPVVLPTGNAAHGKRRASAASRVPQSIVPTVSACEHKWSVQGHMDCVHLLELVNEPTGLLSASSDRCVSMWDTNGFRHGTLLQGLADDMHNPDWDLPVDVQLRTRMEDMNTDQTIHRLWNENKSGPETAVVDAKEPARSKAVSPRNRKSRRGKVPSRAESKKEPTEDTEKHRRVMSALWSTNNMRASSSESQSAPPHALGASQSYAGDELDQLTSGGLSGVPSTESDVFSEYKTFKSSLPPVETLSTQTFVKLTQGQRGAHRTRNLESKLAQDKAAMVKAKREKALANSRSSSALQHVGRMSLADRNEALAAAMPPLQPVFSEESKASVARLADAISSWDNQAVPTKGESKE